MPLDEQDKAWLTGILGTFATKHQLERVETTLLTEFHQWAQQSDQRTRANKEGVRALDLDLEYLQHRVQKLEDHIKSKGN